MAIPPRFAQAFLGTLPAVAIGALWIQHHDFHRMPDADEIARLNRQVAEAMEPGDFGRTEPVWFDGARVGLDGLPFFLGYEPDDWDRHRVNRLWLLLARADRARGLARWATWLRSPETIGATDRYEVIRSEVDDPDGVVWDALDEVASATVSLRSPSGSTESCTLRVDGNVYCGRVNPWVFVGPVIREMDDTYRYCVSATAPEGGRTWVIRWENLPEAARLRIRAGNSQWAVRMPRGAPVTFRVLLDEELWVERTYAIDELGYPEFEREVGELRSMTFEVQADEHEDRFFCFRAQLLRPE